uniref:small ribosomal subunit protein mS40-like n=1 Tax=Myxine glutinosa TaxID=7769 RepID=UPI00358F693E
MALIFSRMLRAWSNFSIQIARAVNTPVQPLLWAFQTRQVPALWCSRYLCSTNAEAPPEEFDPVGRYREKPWEYLDSEEYMTRYGTMPIFTGYRRNHKGSIPPQRPRKTCIRGAKVSGNPCPVCRDPKIIIHPRNIKLLQQFICSHSAQVYDPSITGLCAKRQKELLKVIQEAKDFGLLTFTVPFMEYSPSDLPSDHIATGQLPMPPREPPWYPWYDQMEPSADELAKYRRMFRKYLKE